MCRRHEDENLECTDRVFVCRCMINVWYIDGMVSLDATVHDHSPFYIYLLIPKFISDF